MNERLQGRDEVVVNATPQRIWESLEDSTCLPEWMPMVKRTTGKREMVGAVRECDVQIDGRDGRVIERCVEHSPYHRIAWVLQEDTFGFSKMLSDFGFSFTLEPLGANTTLLRNETYYRPEGLLASLMSVLMMRRKFRRVRQAALANLKRRAEGPRSAGTIERKADHGEPVRAR